ERCLAIEIRLEADSSYAFLHGRCERAPDSIARPAGPLAAEEGELDSAQELGLELRERRDEDPDSFSFSQLAEEGQPVDASCAGRRIRVLVQCRRLRDVRNDARRLGDRPAVLTHPTEQPAARTDDCVTQLERTAFRHPFSEP